MNFISQVMARNKKGQFVKGHKPTGGRKKGVPNKMSTEIRDKIKSIIDWEQFKLRLEQIEDPAKYCAIVLKMMEFVLPKLKQVDQNINAPFTIELPEMNINELKAFVYELDEPETTD